MEENEEREREREKWGGNVGSASCRLQPSTAWLSIHWSCMEMLVKYIILA